jgi:hypothetical protein
VAWIESHQSLLTHRKTARLARRLGISKITAIGHLHALWWWCMDNAQDGSLAGIDIEDISDGSCWDGDPALFIEALVFAGFVDEDENGRHAVHEWPEYAGKLIEKRTSDAARKRSARLGIAVQRTSDGHPADGAGTVPNLTVPNLTQPDHERRPVAAAPVAAAAAPQPEPPVPVEAIQQPRTVAVPKPNRYGQVLDALKERGINYPGGRRDAGEVAKCSAAPALIADAYATFEEWAGDFGMSNKSLWYVCQRIAAYQAWQDGKRARASPNGRAGGLTVQQLLRGEG